MNAAHNYWDQESRELAGSSAMDCAAAIFEAEREGSAGIASLRSMGFDAAKRALRHADAVLSYYPDAVFRYEGTELLLSAAADHLRQTIARAEELCRK